MRSKKLLRQLKKSLECEGIESELSTLGQWIQKREGDAVPESLLKLIGNLPAFFDSVESAYEQAENIYNQAQRSLLISGQEIEERNKLLRTENQKVNNLLNNMRQAVFSVIEKGIIVGPVSKYSSTVFGEDIIEKNVFDVLYCSLGSDSEEYSAVKTALNVVFGESDLQWELSEDSFPKRVIICKNCEKILKVVCSPIWNDKNLLEKIMFVVEDVTEVEKLERRIAQEKAQNSRALQIVHELISLKREDALDFISKTKRAVFYIKKSVEDGNLTAESVNNILQTLHSIKGNARLLGFNFISSAVHKIESSILEINENLEISPEPLSLLRQAFDVPMDQVIFTVDEYNNLILKIFGNEMATSANNENQVEISSQRLEDLKRSLAALRKNSSPETINSVMQMIEHLTDVSLLKEFEKYARVVAQISSDLGKDVDFNIAGEDCFFSRDKLPLVKDAIVHLLRNAIDHGIEAPEDRKNIGKSKTGFLKLIMKQTENKLLILISDDGAGIDHNVVANKVKLKNLKTEAELESMSKEQILDLIFLPQFSTRNEVTELSGRGIGMDVVKTNVKKLGGTISLETKPGKGTLFKIIVPL